MTQPNPRRVARVVWAASVALDLLFLAVAALAPTEPEPVLAKAMFPVVAGLSVVAAALSWLWAVRLRPVARPGTAAPAPDALALTRIVVAIALCEWPALLALAAFLATRDPLMWLPFAVSFAALLTHQPGDRHWARLGGTPAGRGMGRSPMVRE